MRASPILLLVLCHVLVLPLAASAEQEMLTIGKYDISFSLQGFCFDEPTLTLEAGQSQRSVLYPCTPTR